MQNPGSLKSIEKKAFRATLVDGLWDVFIGCIFLIFAIAPTLSETLGDFWSSFIFLPFWGLVYLSIWAIRKYILAPRLGRVVFGQTRKRMLRKFNLVMIGVTTTLIIIGLVTVVFMENLPNKSAFFLFTSFFSISRSILLLIGFSIAAFLLGYPRLYFYGFLIFTALPIGEWLYINERVKHHGFPVVFGVISAIMILTGLAQFTYTLKTNPAIHIEGE